MPLEGMWERQGSAEGPVRPAEQSIHGQVDPVPGFSQSKPHTEYSSAATLISV